MPNSTFHDDIPVDAARSAHRGTSFDPDLRATQERAAYAATLVNDFEELERFAKTDEQRAELTEMFADYREGFRKRTLRQLAAKSRCLSTMITGPSNFNARRAGRASDVADRCTRDLVEYRERMITKMRKTLTGHVAIMTGDTDAVVKLREKLAKLERVQAQMKACNAAIRKHAKRGTDAQIGALMALGLSDQQAIDLLKPDFCGRIGFADYQTKNNGAEIRRLKVRLVEVETTKATPVEQHDGEHARLEDCPADNRVRLFFSGKPAVEIRERLKVAGFRWAPSLGCWQAYRNHSSLVTARREAGIDGSE